MDGRVRNVVWHASERAPSAVLHSFSRDGVSGLTTCLQHGLVMGVGDDCGHAGLSSQLLEEHVSSAGRDFCKIL